MAPFLQADGYHPDDPSTRIMDGFGHTFHQSHITTAIHQRMAPTTYPLAQPTGQGKELWVERIVGRTKNSNIHFFSPFRKTNLF